MKEALKHIKSFMLFCVACIMTVVAVACGSDSPVVDEPGPSPSIPDKWITIDTAQQNFTYEGGTVQLATTLGTGVSASQVEISYTGDGEDWLTATLQSGKLTIVCEHSYTEKNRTASITLKIDDKHRWGIPITQTAAPTSSDTKIKVVGGMADSENVSSTEADNHPFSYSYDGDKNNFFNSKFGKVTYPFHMTYELESGHTLNYIVYTPRSSWNFYGTFNKFSVEVSTTDAPDTFTKIGDYDRGEGYNTKPMEIEVPNGIQNVKKVRFVITKAYEDRVSCSEMEFFEASSHKFEMTSIFADAMGMKLKDGFTEKQIKQIPNDYIKQLGLALLAGNYDSSFRLADYRPYQNPSVMAAINKTNKYSLRDNPTGIYAVAGETLPIFVGKIYQGGNIQMLIQDLGGGYNNFKTYDLKEGYNEITVGVGGLIYILNHTSDDIPLLLDNATAAQKKLIADKTVQIHFCAGKVQGYFDIQKNTAEDWKKILDNAKYKDIDVLGKYSHLTWAVSDFRSFNTDIVKSVENNDKLVYEEENFQGLVKYNKMFNNRMHLCIDYKAESPNATDYRTVYDVPNSTYRSEVFCDVSKFASRSWGPAHEVGHVNQTRPGMKWAGLTEVTNNIQSLNIQEVFGVPCKLFKDACTIGGVKYNTILDGAIAYFVEGKKPHCSENGIRETQLVPFWQLKLYMVDVLGKKDFYKDLYEYFRTHKSPSDNGANQGMNQLDFVRQVCDLAQLDFTSFFSSWGFLTPVNATLNDYGNKQFIITGEDVAALIKEISAKKYKAVPSNLYKITTNNLNDYK